MTRLILALLLCASPAFAQGYITSTETLRPTIPEETWWRFNTYNGHGIIPGAAFADGYPPLQTIQHDTMTFIDLPIWVAPDVVSVSVIGGLVLTHGSLPQLCELRLSIDGLEFGDGYMAQVIESATTGGQRTFLSFDAPVTNAQVGIKWTILDSYYPTAYPYGCSYAAYFYVTGAER